jgi:hypothetical protein
MRKRAYYHQTSNFAIATEILADPDATLREQVLAQRIRGQQGRTEDNGVRRNEHAYD